MPIGGTAMPASHSQLKLTSPLKIVYIGYNNVMVEWQPLNHVHSSDIQYEILLYDDASAERPIETRACKVNQPRKTQSFHNLNSSTKYFAW